MRFCNRYVVPRIRRVRIPAGEAGTLHTARLVAELIEQGARDFYVRQRAIQIFRDYRVPAKDRFGEVAALFDWVRRNIRYTRDIYRVELLHTARRMLELRAGDCDDMTILLGAMLMSTGHPVRLALVGFKPSRPHAYSHIYLEALIGSRWLPLDATIDRPMGSVPPAVWKRICHLRKGGIECAITDT
jgi:transglutaminase-like putative cysteine protease